jgi:hypothetical protein
MEFNRAEPTQANRFQIESAQLIVSSYSQLLRHDLLPECNDRDDLAQRLYQAPFIVLAHENAPDPVFFYANLAAQELFEMNWRDMVRLPSRLSAEALLQDERRKLLESVTRQGYIDDYAGIRISATGKRFRIARATVWNLIDASGSSIGQAAAFSEWAYI